MRSDATSSGVCVSVWRWPRVCILGETVSCAKTAKPTERDAVWNVDSCDWRNFFSAGGGVIPRGKGHFCMREKAKCRPTVKYCMHGGCWAPANECLHSSAVGAKHCSLAASAHSRRVHSPLGEVAMQYFANFLSTLVIILFSTSV